MEKNSSTFVVVFALDTQRFALPLPAVEQVVRAVAVTPLPKAPPVVQGAVDVRGEIAPVMDIRLRFGLPPRPVALSDQLVIVRTRKRLMAFGVDFVADVREWNAGHVVPASAVAPCVEFLDGVASSPDGMILVYDPDVFFLPEESEALDQAMGLVAAHG